MIRLLNVALTRLKGEFVGWDTELPYIGRNSGQV